MVVEIDYNKCDGIDCSGCKDACPTDVFGIKDGKIVVVNAEECTFCMMCEDLCPADAVKVKN
jgi:NAD-dependent dihydropyrimidine dehydrogenase PreA subunit